MTSFAFIDPPDASVDESDDSTSSSSSSSSSCSTYSEDYQRPRLLRMGRLPTRKEASEKMWEWRYRLKHLGKTDEKTLADFSSVDSDDGNVSGKKKKQSSQAAAAAASELGASASIKTLYEGPNSRGPQNYEWVDYPPKQLSKSAAKAQDRVAIKAFKVKDKSKPVISGRFSLCYHMIEVQNPLLVAALGEILKKQDVHLDVNENATFKHPFCELYFGYDDIVAKQRALDESDKEQPLSPYLQLLIRLLDDVFGETRAKLRRLREEGLVSYSLAWAYFPKNTTIITWGNNCELLARVSGTTYSMLDGGEVLLVEGQVLRFAGREFQWESFSCPIAGFSGNKPITDLAAYPLQFHDGADDVKARLTARGRKMLDYQGLTYANYLGIAVDRGNKGKRSHNVEGRVLIDVIGYQKHHLAQGAREGQDPQSKKKVVAGDPDGKKPGEAGKRLSLEDQERNKQAVLAKEAEEPHLMYMLPLIEGYALKNKMWLSFFVEDISPMVWNDKAYEHLVYDEDQKDLVMSFVESHAAAAASAATTVLGKATQNRRQPVEDVIAGKGQGLVMLLSGPPGTGKTLMAEAIADKTQRPLFYLQAEDLGINAASLGANLKKVFQMATEWNAVILLDEADVFMAERHPQDIARNELVSIFLRELEYFQGIIFLTTNLYNTIDSAFRSRVSLHLLFTSLTPEARLLVWRKFLDRLPPPAQVLAGTEEEGGDGVGEMGGEEEEGVLADDELEELAAWQLNGREIKTAVKMARIWCDHKGYQLTLPRLENAIKATSPHASKTSRDKDTSLYDE